MGLLENNKFEEVFLTKKKDKQRLDEEHRNISFLVDNIKTKESLRPKRKPFLKLSLILIIVGIMCLLLINLVPWAYVVYDNNNLDLKNNELYYYSDNTYNIGGDVIFSSFFESGDSNKYLGVNSFALKSIYTTQSYILYAIIALGFIFTIIGLFVINSDFSIKKYRFLNCFCAVLTAILCIYLIFISVKFLGAEVLLFYNGNLISDNIENIALIFISPILMITIASILLKITTTILKVDLKYFEKNFDEKLKNKSNSYGVY